MKHLGDITRINGAEIEPVDVITGGSPCQDLSVAGKRVGLVGERSGLFMEQIRIIKEMRNATNNLFPRYAVWENVPGAFSSNKGEDFRAALEEFCKVVDEDAVIPEPPGGKWRTAGVIMGDGYSIAWRVFDAQYFGVPQRRRRIALVADFRGESAPEILFEREGVSGDIKESGEAREGVAEDSERGVGEAVTFSCGGFSNYKQSKTAATRRACIAKQTDVDLVLKASAFCVEPSAKARGIGYEEEVSPTLRAGVVPGCLCFEPIALDRAAYNMGQNAQYGMSIDEGSVAFGLTAKGPGAVCEVIAQPTTIEMTSTKNTISKNGIRPTLTARMGTGGNQVNAVCDTYQKTSGNGYAVRRLTPLECSRLQGYPDGWCDIGDWRDDKGKLHKDSDSSKYKALGNSIALPPWRWLLRRMAERLPQGATIGSLFDGIGGFPLIWSEINGIDACKWASEIEPYCIAVTEHRFNIKKPAAGTADKEDSTIIVTHQILIVKGN